MITEPGTVTVNQFDSDGTWLIALEGEHDAFWTTCSTAIVDLTATTFIDAAVVSWLPRARRAASSARLTVVSRPGCVASRILDVAGVRDALDCYPSPATARQPTG